MALKISFKNKTETEPKFPRLMHTEGNVYMVTHNQEVGLSRVLLSSKTIPERIGYSHVIDDTQLIRMTDYTYALILENDNA